MLLQCFLIAVALNQARAAISQCPSNAISVAYDDGSVYEICPQTTFTGTTTRNVSGTLSSWDCLQQCAIDPSCQRAAYRDTSRSCWLKSNSTTWSTTANWDSIHLVKRNPQIQSTNKGLGLWSTVLLTPVLPAAAYIIPEYPISSRVLMFSSWGPDDFTTGTATGYTQFTDFNFTSGAISARTVSNTHHDMFCPGMSFLEDGRLMISGGSNAEVTSFYDPTTNNFTRGPDLNIPRGYHASAVTSKAQVFTIGGSFSGGIGGKNGELFDPDADTWSLLPNIPVEPILTHDEGGDFRSDNHPWLYGWKNGSVFHAGPSQMQHWFDTAAPGAVQEAGMRDPNSDAMCAVHVMYDAVAGKVFSAGGSPSYTNSDAITTAHETTIGDPFSPVVVEQVGNLLHPRGLANGVVLPDGTVLITGGQTRSIIFTDTDSWLTPELYDPTTRSFRELAAAAIPRNYHSISLLLPDARVLVGGGGLCDTPYNQSDAQCRRTTDHPDIEIFSPPYLFNVNNTAASRPVISSIQASSDSSGRTVVVGGILNVSMDQEDAYTFSLVRMGSVTHSTNTDQRRVPLHNVQQQSSLFTIFLPQEPGVLIPGYYYLFAMDSNGVPSMAATIRVVLA